MNEVICGLFIKWRTMKTDQIAIKKHFLIFIFSGLFLMGTLFLFGKTSNQANIKKVEFGYPFSFLKEDFSDYNENFSFFPRYFKLELKKLFWKNVNWINLLFSWLSIFFGLELIIYILEEIIFRIKLRFKK